MHKTRLAGQTIFLALGGISLPVAGLYLTRFLRGSQRLAGTATTSVLWKAGNIGSAGPWVNSLKRIFCPNFSYFCNFSQCAARFQHRAPHRSNIQAKIVSFCFAVAAIDKSQSAIQTRKGAASAAPHSIPFYKIIQRRFLQIPLPQHYHLLQQRRLRELPFQPPSPLRALYRGQPR